MYIPKYIYLDYITYTANYFKAISMRDKILLNIFSLRKSSAFHNLRWRQKYWCNTAVFNAQSSPTCQWVGECSNHERTLSSFWSFISVIKRSEEGAQWVTHFLLKTAICNSNFLKQLFSIIREIQACFKIKKKKTKLHGYTKNKF